MKSRKSMFLQAAVAGLFTAGSFATMGLAAEKGNCVGKNSCQGMFEGKEHSCGGYTIKDVSKEECMAFKNKDKENKYKFGWVAQKAKK